MIVDHWYAVLHSPALRRRPLAVRRLGLDLVFWRSPQGVSAAIDRCTHRGAKLSAGRMVGDCLECPYHGNRYAADGRCVAIPSLGMGHAPPEHRHDLKVLPVRDQHGFIWVWHGAPRSEYPPVPWIDEIPRGLANSGFREVVVPVHYARVVETYFDLHHAPFAHRPYFSLMATKIGASEVEVKGDEIIYRAELKRDPDLKSLWHRIEHKVVNRIKMPNFVFGQLTPRLHVVTIATPVDEQSTWMAVRVYQRYLPLPLVGRLVARLVLLADAFFVRHDLRILTAMTPQAPRLADVRPVHGDNGVIHYFRLRERLLSKSASGPQKP